MLVHRLQRPTLAFKRLVKSSAFESFPLLQRSFYQNISGDNFVNFILWLQRKQIIFGAFGLPFGLIMTLVTGGELFTGNTALVAASAMEGKTTPAELIKSWVASYAGNFVGSLIIAYLAFKSGTLGTAPACAAIATAKCALSFETAFVRGILCNWLVCMAVYMASGCASLAGKMIAVWFPISAFVALGLDHSVANMFIIPLGMMRGANVSIYDFLMKNLLPVTLGNIVGGALCVMGVYGSAFGKWFQKKE